MISQGHINQLPTPKPVTPNNESLKIPFSIETVLQGIQTSPTTFKVFICLIIAIAIGLDCLFIVSRIY